MPIWWNRYWWKGSFTCGIQALSHWCNTNHWNCSMRRAEAQGATKWRWSSHTSASITACCIPRLLVKLILKRKHFHTNLYSSPICHKHETASYDLSHFQYCCLLGIVVGIIMQLSRVLTKRNVNQVCSNSNCGPTRWAARHSWRSCRVNWRSIVIILSKNTAKM